MSRPHEEFKILTALAAINQISDCECNALSEHLQTCAACRQQLGQMKAASFTYFSHHISRSKNKSLPAEIRARSSRRLTSLGIPPGSPSLASPIRSLRVAIAILAFAAVALSVVRTFSKGHHPISSAQTEIAAEQPFSKSPAASPRVFTASRLPKLTVRRRRSRNSGLTTEAALQAQDSSSAEEHVPYFRLGYPGASLKMYSRPFTVPSAPSFPLMEVGKGVSGAKTFELASIPSLPQGEASNIANALRFIPPGDLTHPESISTQPRFNLPPLTEGRLLRINTNH